MTTGTPTYGTLAAVAIERGERAGDMLTDVMSVQGMDYQTAWEFASQEIYPAPLVGRQVVKRVSYTVPAINGLTHMQSHP